MVYVKRETLVEDLKRLNVEFDEKCTVPELKVLWDQHKPPKNKKEEAPDYGMWKLRKPELVEKCKELRLHHGQHATMVQLQALIKGYARRSTTDVDKNLYDDSYMGFGKHENRTFLEVYTDFPSYISWAQTTVEEDNEADWRLIRFVKYAQKKKAGADTAPKVKIEKEKVKIEKEWVQVETTASRASASTSSPAAVAASASAERMDRMENMLLTILKAIPNPPAPTTPTNEMDSRTSGKRSVSPQ